MKLQLLCALLLVGTSAVYAHLGTYSETRSFRDALDGRSMEEAMSGPVDKDTSSYGDRTPSNNNNQVPSLSIPANGNLMPMSPAADNGGELEREASPVGSSAGTMDSQQRVMEQRTERQRATIGGQPRQSPAMAGQRLSSGRQQQQQQVDQTDATYEQKGPNGNGNGNGNGKTSTSDAGFGEDPNATPAKGGRASDKSAADMPMKMAYDDQQQQSSTTGEEKGSSGQAAKQRMAMAAMLMSMNKALKYSRGASSVATTMSPMSSVSYQGASGVKSGADGGLGMTMPLSDFAGKTPPGAYGQQQRRQMGSTAMSPMSMMSSSGRAQKQRRLGEKKMSPSMVNAMLKKMLVGQMSMGAGSYGAKPAAMAMLIKSPAGAELLTNMMAVPQVAGAVAGMSPSKREQYKRMMMAAVMQQASANAAQEAQDASRGEDEEQQQQQQQQSDGYGQTNEQDDMMDASPPAPGSKGAKSYANQQMLSSTVSPMSLMTMMNMMKASKYNGGQRQQYMDSGDMQTTEAPIGSTKGVQQSKKGYAMEQQQQQQVMSGSYPDSSMPMNGYGAMNNEQREMTPVALKMMAMMKAKQHMMTMRAAQYGSSTPSTPMGMMIRTNGKAGTRYNQQGHNLMEAQLKEDSKGGYNMDNNRNLGEADQQQQHVMMSTTEATTGSYAGQEALDAPTMASIMMNPGNSRPTTLASSQMNGMTRNQLHAYGKQQQETSTMASATKGQAMARPMQAYGGGSSSEMGSTMDEQQEQQQQQDEYGAAPMGMAEPFAFDYKIEDDYGNGQYRKEESDKNGVVRGSYGYMDNNGIYRHVDYVADENGFRANVKSNEPGLNGADSKSPGAQSPQMMSQMMNGNGMAPQMSPAAFAQMINQMSMASGVGATSQGVSQQQQQSLQQQQQMLMPAQQELNENGENSHLINQ